MRTSLRRAAFGRRATAALLALTLAPAAAAAQTEVDTTAALLHAMALDVREAGGLATGIQDAALRARIEAALERIERRRALLDRQVGADAGTRVPPPSPPPVVSEADLARLLQAMQAAGFDNRRLPLLKDFVARQRLGAEQGARLVEAFAFGDGRVEAAVAIHPRLVDPANFFQVLGALAFDGERDRVRQRLGLPR